MHGQTSNKNSRGGWLPWAVSAVGVAAILAFLILYPPAKELAWETSRIVFTLFFTPFIMEAICIVIGILVVITLNNRRLARDAADEWVYLHQVDPEPTSAEPSSAEPSLGEPAVEIPEPLRHRIEDAPFVTKPTPAGAAERAAEIGGYLDLGMTGEAADALLQAPEESLGTPDYLLLRIRLAHLREESQIVEELTAAARLAGVSESEIESAIRP